MTKRCTKKVKPIGSDKKREDVKFNALEDKAIEMEKVRSASLSLRSAVV